MSNNANQSHVHHHMFYHVVPASTSQPPHLHLSIGVSTFYLIKDLLISNKFELDILGSSATRASAAIESSDSSESVCACY